MPKEAAKKATRETAKNAKSLGNVGVSGVFTVWQMYQNGEYMDSQRGPEKEGWAKIHGAKKETKK